MTRQSQEESHSLDRTRLFALTLIGGGLMLLGAIGIVYLTRAPEQTITTRTESAVPLQVDFPAPDLKLVGLQGEPVALADFAGQVVLINNWATWCPPCQKEMPDLQAYYLDHQKQGFSVIAIESGEPAAEVAGFVQDYGLTFPVWVDEGERAIDAFHNLGLPNSYLVDRGGQVRLAWNGAISREMLESYVTPLVEE